MTKDAIGQYLLRAATWVENGYVNICHTYRTPNGKVSIPGNACCTVDEAIGQVIYWSREKNSDVYCAMGGYENHAGNNKFGPPKAFRRQSNVIACRCLYLDIDVDPNPKKDAYRTIEDMEASIKAFYAYTGLPPASLSVNSGRGGRHLYYPFNRLLHPTDWQLFAHAIVQAARDSGLKFDSACTVDCTRLLRVPGTWNFKDGTRKDVTIEDDTGIEFDPNNIAQILSKWWGKNHVSTINSPSNPKQDNNPDYDELKDDLGAGIDDYPKADLDLITKKCPFIKDTLETGGEGLDEPLWHLSIAIACHTSNPEGDAHRLSNKHHAYEPTETIEKLKQAQRDRQQRKDLGPPRCKTISDAGATQCKICPHIHSNPTPVSFGFRVNGHSYLTPIGPRNKNDPDLPFGYWRDKHSHHIWYESKGNTNKPGDQICVFPFQILPNSAYLESASPYQFAFTTIEAGKPKQIKVNQPAMSSRERAAVELGGQGLSVNYRETTKEFFVGFLQMLHSQPTTMINLPAVGWHSDGTHMGFAFHGSYFSPGGVQKCRILPPEVSNYGVVGDTKTWSDLANVVVNYQRPDLSILVAQGFAGPLVVLSGHSGYLLGCWSIESGVGKSTALTLAQTIWGSPVEKNGLSDTEAHVFAKASVLKNIPICFDEMKTMRQHANFMNLIFQMTAGRDKGRADRSGNMRSTKDFQTLLTYATNASMVAAVEENTKGSYATILRLFEFPALENTSLKYSPSEIARMTVSLNHNYGGIGFKYAQFLGENYDMAVKCIKHIQLKIEKQLNMTQDERFWGAAIANTLAGAYFAKKLQFCDFDLDIMEAFLVAEFQRMRQGKLVSPVDYSNVNTVIGELAGFLKEHRARNTIVTDIMLMGPGQPKRGSVKVLNEEPGVRKENVAVHIGLAPTLTIRISDSTLGLWCKLRNVPKASLVEALNVKLGARKGNARIGSGTIYVVATEPCWTIPVVGSPLEKEVEYVEQYS